jgi:hypothetical protein
VPPSLRDPKPFQRSLEEKAKGREKMIKAYTGVVTKYQQADSTIASLYRIAESWDEFVKGVLGVPCPKGLTDEVCGYIKEELEKTAAPAREAAFAAYKACVAKSNELNTFTTFSTKCAKALETIAPDNYPPIIERSINYSQPDRMDSMQSNPLIMKSNGYTPVDPSIAKTEPKRDLDEPEEE